VCIRGSVRALFVLTLIDYLIDVDSSRARE